MVGEDPVALLEGRLRALLLVAAAGVGRAPHGGDESVPPALSVPSEKRERDSAARETNGPFWGPTKTRQARNKQHQI
jgi:hypothetical protein